MKRDNSYILTVNGGFSSIKFALYRVGEPLKPGLHGKVDRAGLSGTNLAFHDADGQPQASRKLAAIDHKSAANSLIVWLEARPEFASVKAVGHRVVHGIKHTEPEIVTKKTIGWTASHHPAQVKGRRPQGARAKGSSLAPCSFYLASDPALPLERRPHISSGSPGEF